jgi:hypothetical protein
VDPADMLYVPDGMLLSDASRLVEHRKPLALAIEASHKTLGLVFPEALVEESGIGQRHVAELLDSATVTIREEAVQRRLSKLRKGPRRRA